MTVTRFKSGDRAVSPKLEVAGVVVCYRDVRVGDEERQVLSLQLDDGTIHDSVPAVDCLMAGEPIVERVDTRRKEPEPVDVFAVSAEIAGGKRRAGCLATDAEIRALAGGLLELKAALEAIEVTDRSDTYGIGEPAGDHTPPLADDGGPGRWLAPRQIVRSFLTNGTEQTGIPT